MKTARTSPRNDQAALELAAGRSGFDRRPWPRNKSGPYVVGEYVEIGEGELVEIVQIRRDGRRAVEYLVRTVGDQVEARIKPQAILGRPRILLSSAA